MTADQLTIDEAVTQRDAVLHLIVIDPRMSPTIRAVAAAIDAVASPGDTVSANDIRAHLPSWVKTKGIGPAFGALVKAGALRKVAWVVSTDRGTHGKPVGQYVLLGSASEVAA